MPTLFKVLLAGIFCISAAQSVVIKCVFIVTFWETVGFCYHCRATIVNNADASELTGVQGNHLWWHGNKQVLSFSIAGQNAPRILKNIDNFFPNLIALEWSRTNLQVISAGDLKQFSKLKVLSLSNNHISHLDGQLFSNTRKLKSLYVNNVQLKSVGAGIFSGLSDLINVWLLHNPCINSKAIGTWFVHKLGNRLPTVCPVPVTTTTTQKMTTTTERTTTTQRPTTTTERMTTTRTTTKPLTTIVVPSTTQSQSTTSGKPSTTTRRPDSTTTSRPTTDECELSHHFIMPHPTDCTKYFECIRGKKHRRRCPEGQIFDINSLACGDVETSVCAN